MEIVGSYDFLILYDPEPGSSFRMWWDDQLRKEARSECTHDAEPPDAGSTFWLTMWNRTGLTYHHEHQVNFSQGLDMTFTLPSDPPYLLFPGINCFVDFYAEFNSTLWRREREKNSQTPVEESSNLVVERNRTRVEIEIPAGQLSGSSTYPVLGKNAMIELGPTPGGVERSGARYGTLDSRQPTGQLLHHLYFDPIDQGWRNVHALTGMPGLYQFQVNLTAPSVNESVWVADMWEYVFTPRITEAGFTRPFNLYWDP